MLNKETDTANGAANLINLFIELVIYYSAVVKVVDIQWRSERWQQCFAQLDQQKYMTSFVTSILFNSYLSYIFLP